MKKWRVPFAVTGGLCILCALVSCTYLLDIWPTETVQIGVLLPLTGISPVHGESHRVAVELAAADVNTAQNTDVKVELVVKDTESKMDKAVTYLREMAESGVRIVVSAGTSAELEVLKYVADSEGVIILNQGSTAPSLSVADNVFRMTPGDEILSEAMADVMKHDGIEHVVLFIRSDIWGIDLTGFIRSAFSQRGGEVAEQIFYSATKTGIDFDVKMQELNAAVIYATTRYGASRVAVGLLSFNEGVEILRRASAYPALSAVRWYGSDGMTQDPELVEVSQAAGFAEETAFASPLVGEGDSQSYRTIQQAIEAETGTPAYSSALLSYDALWIAALTLDTSNKDDSIEELKENLTEVMQAYQGIAGPYAMNMAGDQTVARYDFWTVRAQGTGQHEWERAFTYTDGQIEQHRR